MRMLSQDEEKDDSEVSWEDQQRINTFSKLNIRYQHILSKLKQLKEEKEALDDLSMELELADEDEVVLYRVGETFVHLPHSRALKRLDHDVESVNQEVDSLAANADDCQKEMRELKIVLYARFGSAINLDE